MSYNYAACELTTALRNAITGAAAVTLFARIRPTWSNDGERFTFGVGNADPDNLSGNNSNPGPIIDCQSNRTGGGIYNAIGCSWRRGDNVTVGAAQTPSSDLAGAWLDIAATIVDANTAVPTLRLYDRPDESQPWNLRRTFNPVSGATGLLVHANAATLMAGNRRTNFAGQGNVAERWPGGIAAVSLAVGTGPSDTPGGTEIARWQPEPPARTTTDPYGNVWTIHGPDWTWGTVS